jgi:hypothetical protein
MSTLTFKEDNPKHPLTAIASGERALTLVAAFGSKLNPHSFTYPKQDGIDMTSKYIASYISESALAAQGVNPEPEHFHQGIVYSINDMICLKFKNKRFPSEHIHFNLLKAIMIGMHMTQD